ncbi:MAG: cell envelope integrity protein TolA [Proteobacteria bacterium]|nr:cell envelope integrity protein TolA [Pseudomonadota bacterium]
MIDRIATWLKTNVDWRQPGGAVSAGGHVLVLTIGLLGLSSAKPFQPAGESVAVDVVSEKDFNEMMKGDKNSKEVAKQPERRVDKVAEIKKDNDPGEAKKDVAAPEPPKASPPPVPAEQKVASVTPPARPPELRVAPPRPVPPPAQAEEEEEDREAEIIRQKKAAEKRKAEEAAKAAADEKRKLEETLKAEAEAQKRAEDKRKADEAKKAEDLKKAEAARREKEAKEKARQEQLAKEKAEEQKLLAAINNKLNTSKEAPSSTGSTGQQVASRSTAGTSTATGNSLSPSDKARLIGIFTDQMLRCLNYPGTLPTARPQFHFSVAKDGSITSTVELKNRSNDPNFIAYTEAAKRAFRACQPYRIPDRFLATYDDWKNLDIVIDASGN